MVKENENELRIMKAEVLKNIIRMGRKIENILIIINIEK
jgi:hypothetical protein